MNVPEHLPALQRAVDIAPKMVGHQPDGETLATLDNLAFCAEKCYLEPESDAILERRRHVITQDVPRLIHEVMRLREQLGATT